MFAPLTYGNPWTQESCKSVKLFETWDFDCNTFHTDYSKYSTPLPNFGDATPTASSAQAASPIEGEGDAVVTPEPAADQVIIGREERIEYRDQNGNLLDKAQVAELEKEGKVSFEYKYETRTRVVDAAGNELPASEAVAPEHPDVEGQNPDTKGVPESEGQSEPAEAPIPSIAAVNKEEDGQPKPAGDANEPSES